MTDEIDDETAANEYMYGIIQEACAISETMGNKIVSGDTVTLDDKDICVLIIDAVSGIVAVNGGDFLWPGHRESIAVLLGCAGQLYARTLKKMAHLESMQSGVAN